MVTPDTCRAARALIDWSQQQLAKAARVGISTVKSFEAGTHAPMANNLDAILRALEGAGIEFVSEEDGGPGVLLRRLRLRAYMPGEGIYVEAKYVDLSFDAGDNDFDLSFKISDAALSELAGRPICHEADAKAIIRKNDAKLVRVLKAVLAREGLSFPGGRPREIGREDIRGSSIEATNE